MNNATHKSEQFSFLDFLFGLFWDLLLFVSGPYVGWAIFEDTFIQAFISLSIVIMALSNLYIFDNFGSSANVFGLVHSIAWIFLAGLGGTLVANDFKLTQGLVRSLMIGAPLACVYAAFYVALKHPDRHFPYNTLNGSLFAGVFSVAWVAWYIWR